MFSKDRFIYCLFGKLRRKCGLRLILFFCQLYKRHKEQFILESLFWFAPKVLQRKAFLWVHILEDSLQYLLKHAMDRLWKITNSDISKPLLTSKVPRGHQVCISPSNSKVLQATGSPCMCPFVQNRPLPSGTAMLLRAWSTFKPCWHSCARYPSLVAGRTQSGNPENEAFWVPAWDASRE